MTDLRSVAVVGLGINNRPLVPYWLERGAFVIAADRRPVTEIEAELAPWKGPRLKIVAGADYLSQLSECTEIEAAYLTPGMVKDSPELKRLAAKGVRLTSETDLFLSRCPVPVLGITGSAGKTTTTTLIGQALARSGVDVAVGGNIGRPLLPELDTFRPPMWVVMELSSFQLDLVEHSPHGAVWLNLRPNHLDIHGTMEAYARAKRHILEFQNQERDWAVVPWNDPRVLSVAGQLGGRRYYVRLDGPVPLGAYLDGGHLWWRPETTHPAERVVAAEAVRLRGTHNLFNLLAATAAVLMAGGSLEAVREIAQTFRGVPHRLESVRELAGVTYINDSIATAPDRTLAALKAVEGPIVLIAGGYDKHLDYGEFGEMVATSRVRSVVLIGQTAEKIESALRTAKAACSVYRAADLEEAVRTAREWAQPGDTVLLSPASASYDMFTNFEERGQRFREIVGSL